MQTATMTTAALITLNAAIGRKLDAASPGSDESRQLLRERRRVRAALEGRKIASTN